MTSNGALNGFWTGIAVVTVVTIGATSPLFAKTSVEPRSTTATTGSSPTSSPIEALPRAIVADNVVVTPSPEPTQPQPSPAPVAVPEAVAPAVPVAQPETTRHKEVRAEVSSSPNYMSTIAVSALMGGVAGLLVGGALHYIDSGEAWRNVGYWAAGGVLVGAGVGVVQLVVQENRMSEATALKHLSSDPAPTYRLALMRLEF
jgi:hypothetical protein